MRRILILFCFLVQSQCVGPQPANEHSLAKIALDSANKHKAYEKSGGLYLKANDLYQLAERLLEEKKSGEAKRLFIRSRQLAERAENISRLKQFRSGESGP